MSLIYSRITLTVTMENRHDLIPPAARDLCPSLLSTFFLVPCHYAAYNTDGSHFSVYAYNSLFNQWVTLGFWTVWRNNGAGDGANASGFADLGQQMFVLSYASIFSNTHTNMLSVLQPPVLQVPKSAVFLQSMAPSYFPTSYY
jgi:hypothetical protein